MWDMIDDSHVDNLAKIYVGAVGAPSDGHQHGGHKARHTLGD